MSPFVMHLVAPVASGIVVESVATSADPASTDPITPSLPSGITSGDLLVLAIRLATSGRAATTPTGWTLITSGFADNGLFAVFARDADGLEGSTVSVNLDGTAQYAANAYRISGAHGVASGVEGSTVYTDLAAPNPPSLTPSWGSAENLWLVFATSRRTDNAFTLPVNYTDLVDAETAPADTSTGDARLSSGRRLLTATSEDPAAFGETGTMNRSGAATVAIRPA